MGGPMRLHVNVSRRIDLPLYAQIAQQVEYLIHSGQLTSGAQLPSPIQLARNLRINRNTIVKAYEELKRRGYVATYNGRGSFVAENHPTSMDKAVHSELVDQLDTLIKRASALGLRTEQLVSLVLVRAASLAAHPPRVTVLLLECNSSSLAHYTGELERELGVAVVPVIISDLDGGGDEELLARAAGCDFAVSTFYHLADVRRKLRQGSRFRSLEIFAITVRPHLEVITRLTALPAGTRLGVVYCRNEPFAERRLQAMTGVIQSIHVPNLEVTNVFFDPETPDPAVFRGCDALLVRPESLEQVRNWTPPGVEIVEFVNVFDAAASQMLKDVVAEFQARKVQNGEPEEAGAARVPTSGAMTHRDDVGM